MSDPICLEQYDAEFLGVLAMQHLEVFELKPPFYYFAPHRLVNRDHARIYPLYDALRRRFGCDTNLDLNRLARSTSAGSVQGMTGHGGWPLTTFLDPDGVPFYGGTYFPPEARQGMPSFRMVLEAVVESLDAEGIKAVIASAA